MPLLNLLFWLFIGAFLLQIAYYLFFLISYLSKTPLRPVLKNKPALSLIVCAKNEADNLRSNVPLLLEQSHPDFELVLVNDNSSDNSLELMEAFARKDERVKVVNVKQVESFWGNKKYALTLGIKAATKPYLVFTDADCKPRSNTWLQHMAGAFSKDQRIVIGYGAYRTVKGSFLNTFIRFETLLTAIQYFSYASVGLSYMGVGRNLAYQRALFFEHAGFMDHMGVMSGDDDLFINRAATSSNVALLDHPDAATVSTPKRRFWAWYRQKRRHVTTSAYYKPLHKLLLGGFFLSQLLFLLLSVVLLISGFQWPVLLVLILLRYLLVGFSYYKGVNKFEEKGLLLLTPVLELLLVLVQFTIFSHNLISKPKHWN
jgi:glycosyltransferase involved in cell wall biosynthesis